MRRPAARPDSGRFLVTGPGYERSASSEGAAIGLAQNQAVRATEVGTWYVREWDTVTWHIERLEDGVVITMGCGPAT